MRQITRQRLLYIVCDCLAVTFGIFLFNVYRHWRIYGSVSDGFRQWSHDPHVAWGYVVFPLAMLLVYGILGFYKSPVFKSRYESLAVTSIGAFVGTLGIYFTIMVNDSFNERMLHYSILLTLLLSLFVPVIVERMAISSYFRRRIKAGKNSFNVLVVGSGPETVGFARKLEKANSKKGFKVIDIVDADNPSIAKIIAENDIKAFVALPPADDNRLAVELINKLYGYDLTILIPLNFHTLLTSRPKLSDVVGEPMVDITAPGLSPASANIKRIIDVLVSAVALVILIPVYLIIALLIKSSSKGPVFYTQKRIGLHRKPFKIIKFRTMIEDSEPFGPELSSTNDKRITRIGHVLRKYRLDETPQFWNVLRGDMSLVGPRPEREYFLNELVKREPAICTIHKVRPGLTSLGTVKFGYASTVDEMTHRLYYDLLYLDNMSLSMDIKVLFHTIETIVTGRGI